MKMWVMTAVPRDVAREARKRGWRKKPRKPGQGGPIGGHRLGGQVVESFSSYDAAQRAAEEYRKQGYVVTVRRRRVVKSL